MTVIRTYTDRTILQTELMDKLGRRYSNKNSTTVVAVTGYGGSGKSQLVLHHIDTHKDEYSPILWIDAQSADSIRSSLERCCRALDISPRTFAGVQDSLDVDAYTQAVRQWLEARASPDTGWLVVLDNVDEILQDPSFDLRNMLPSSNRGTIIITSRDRRVHTMFQGDLEIVQIGDMEKTEAIALLTRRFEHEYGVEDEILGSLAEKIVSQLQQMPLAVDIAGAQIAASIYDGDNAVSAMQTFLEDYSRHRNDLLKRGIGFNELSSYNKTVWTVWDNSFKSIEKGFGPVPGQLLQFLAFFRYSGIPDELFRLASEGLASLFGGPDADRTELPAWLFDGVLSLNPSGHWDDFNYRQAVSPLLRYGLLRLSAGPTVKAMHALVHWRVSLERSDPHAWDSYVTFLAAASRAVLGEDNRAESRRLLIDHIPPSSVLLNRMRNFEPSTRGVIALTIGHVWFEEKNLHEAEILFSDSTRVTLETVGPEHEDHLRAFSLLASTWAEQRRWKAAEDSFEWLVATKQKIFGPRHRDTLQTVGLLAQIYHAQGRQRDAEDLAVRSLEYEKIELGELHPNTLLSMDNLAAMYLDSGKWSDAEKLQVQVVRGMRIVKGERHHDTLTSMNNLAITYRYQQRYTEAEELMTQAIEVQKAVLGGEHPSTLKSMTGLALTYSEQGRGDEAAELQGLAIKASIKTMGERHPDTFVAMDNLALIYRRQERFAEAEELQVRSVDGLKRALGQEHQTTLTSMNDLVVTYAHQGRWNEAQELQQQVIEARTKVLGPNNYHTLMSENNQAMMYGSQRRWEEAAQLLEPIVKRFQASQGKTNAYTLRSMENLVLIYKNQGKADEAEKLDGEIKDIKDSMSTSPS